MADKKSNASGPARISYVDSQTSSVKPGVLFRLSDSEVLFRQRFTPDRANLQFLSCGEFTLSPGSVSVPFCRPEEESLLFMWRGSTSVEVRGTLYELAPYDTLYIPRAAAFRLLNRSNDPALLIQCSAACEHEHPAFHSRFAEFSRREERIRRLKGKDVYMMFDVSESADKLVAGYTFFQPFQRSWPPHNHTDQEEVYIFINGHGSMEVYESPEKLWFVHSLQEGDLVTIPMLNYHPVFSQESPLEFIWCIAGARYWVGDRNKDFMAGKGDALTT